MPDFSELIKALDNFKKRNKEAEIAHCKKLQRIAKLPNIQYNEKHHLSLKEIYRNNYNQIVYVIFNGGEVYLARGNCDWEFFIEKGIFKPLSKQEIENQIALHEMRKNYEKI